MPRTLRVVFAGVCFMIASATRAAPLRVLYFTKSSGFEHSVIKHGSDGPSYSEKILARLGEKHDIAFTFTKDGSLFTPEYLEGFDVLLFYTSGDLLTVGTDGTPAMTPAGKQALIDAVKQGKGFVGLHSCSDTFHTQEAGKPGNRFKNYGDGADLFIKMLGGEFIRHGPQQTATARIVSPGFPGYEKLGAELTTHEEWYSLKEFAADMHALLVLETQGMQGTDYARPPFPIAWARHFGAGRVAYHAMGHREDVWDSEAYQQMVVGAIEWTGKRVDAATPPNLAAVAPEHATLPPPPPAK